MSTLSSQTIERIRKLGFASEGPLPVDRLVSATGAVACLPMYMVSNVHGWTAERQAKFLEVEGSEAVREAYAIGAGKADLSLEAAHDEVLSGFLTKDHPADLVIYEYALETLRRLLREVEPEVAEQIRAFVASSTVSVAKAAGKGLLGTGQRVTQEERACITTIDELLALSSSDAAATALAELD